MKFVVFQTPPDAPATNTVLPDVSDGSNAIPPMRSAISSEFSAAGPMAVHALFVSALTGSCVKRRKCGVIWSAIGSPRPVDGTDLGRNKLQRSSVPDKVPWLVICKIHVPRLP